MYIFKCVYKELHLRSYINRHLYGTTDYRLVTHKTIKIITKKKKKLLSVCLLHICSTRCSALQAKGTKYENKKSTLSLSSKL